MERRDNGLLKISEIAEMAHVLPSTIRHYTDLGLIRFAATTDGGHRLYDRSETMLRLARIRRLSARGVSLPEIKDEFSGAGKKRILVVDDEPEVGDFVSDLLRDRFPCEIRIAPDGFTAGRMLSDFMPDLVFLDLMLPGVDGFGVCRQIRTDPELSGTKVIAVSGYDTDENKKKIMAAGADRFLPKPLGAREVVEMVYDVLNLPRQNSTSG